MHTNLKYPKVVFKSPFSKETGGFFAFGIHHLTSPLDRYYRDFCSGPASVESEVRLFFFESGMIPAATL